MRIRLAILLSLFGATAKADFIYGSGPPSLPATKTDLTPIPPGADPRRYFQASDYNSMAGASYDLRSAIVGGAYHGLTAQSSDPGAQSLYANVNYDWVKTNGQWHFCYGNNPCADNQIAYGPVTSKGDILPYNGTNFARLGVGSDGQVLTADSTQASGVKWATPSGGVTSVTGSNGVTASPTTGAVGVSLDQTFSPTWSGTHTFSLSSGVILGPGSGASAINLRFANANTGTLAWNPTGSRTLTLPDTTSTLVAANDVHLLPTGTVQGQTAYYNGTSWVVLAPGVNGQFLTTAGSGANPFWSTGVTAPASYPGIMSGDASSGVCNFDGVSTACGYTPVAGVYTLGNGEPIDLNMANGSSCGGGAQTTTIITACTALFWQGTFTINSNCTIQYNGNNANGFNNGAALGFNNGGWCYNNAPDGAGGISSGSSGAAGGYNGANGGGAPNFMLGGAGGNGGSGSGGVGTGGNGGTNAGNSTIHPNALGGPWAMMGIIHRFDGTIFPLLGGGGGGSGGVNQTVAGAAGTAPGGGGSGGGPVYLFGESLVLNGHITSLGGNGGNQGFFNCAGGGSASTGGGGGGGGGFIRLVVNLGSGTNWPLTTASVAGGSGGVGGHCGSATDGNPGSAGSTGRIFVPPSS